MKPILLTLTALGAVAAAASPAAAQNYGYGQNNGYYSSTNQDRYYDHAYNDGWQGQLSSRSAIDARISRLGARLDAGVRAGTIDRYEADRLRAELNDLRNLSRSYGYGGISASERAEIASRLMRVREDIRTADNGSWDRYDSAEWGGGGTGYGYDQSYGRTDGTRSYGGTYGNGYAGTDGTRSYSGTYGNGYAGTDGSRSYVSTYGNGYSNGSGSSTYSNGYGSTYGNATSGYDSRYDNGSRGGYDDDADGAMLRVGERAPGNLYGVPYEMQGTYRDGYGYYYRSDGQAIYQINSRTGTVMRVYPMNR